MNNYAVQRERAKARFLTYSYEALAEKWKLADDGVYLYVEFLGERYRIARGTAETERLLREENAVEPASFEETLAIFDLLCHTEGEAPKASGIFAPVNSLKGRPRTIGVDEKMTGKQAELYDSDWEAFRRACEHIGGEEIKLGDIGYEFTVFRDLKLRIKFYGADEEFPAQIVYLWDENALEYLYYETAFYVMFYLGGKLAKLMEGEE
ncbi:MAG: DUF3786 domain-containing protein [Eubacteriales bacterium]|nr:DUF3786 domain-containing protein [Eubacteriales bacterium]